MARASKTVKKTKPTKKIPARAAAPEKGFMSDGLLVELEAIAEDSRVDELRANILSHLKNKLTQAKALARERFERGRLDGIETARLLAAVHDGTIQGLWKFTSKHIVIA